MPTYDYQCSHCGHAFEAFQKMTDAPLDKCPKCSSKVKRLISSGVGIIFKGSGFYETDYKKKTPSTESVAPACPKAKEGCNGCSQHS